LSPPSFLWSMRLNWLVVFLLQLLNATGWLFEPAPGVYFLAVFLILPGTAFAFGRLLFEFLRRRAAFYEDGAVKPSSSDDAGGE